MSYWERQIFAHTQMDHAESDHLNKAAVNLNGKNKFEINIFESTDRLKK